MTVLENERLREAAGLWRLYFESGRWAGAVLADGMTAIGRYDSHNIVPVTGHCRVRYSIGSNRGNEPSYLFADPAFPATGPRISTPSITLASDSTTLWRSAYATRHCCCSQSSVTVLSFRRMIRPLRSL